MGKDRGWEEDWVIDNPDKLDSCADHIEYRPRGYTRVDLRSVKERLEENMRALKMAIAVIDRELEKNRSKK